MQVSSLTGEPDVVELYWVRNAQPYATGYWLSIFSRAPRLGNL